MLRQPRTDAAHEHLFDGALDDEAGDEDVIGGADVGAGGDVDEARRVDGERGGGGGVVDLGEGEAAGRERDARHRVEGEAGHFVGGIELVLTEESLDHGALLGAHAGDDEVLVRGEAEVTFVREGDLAERGVRPDADWAYEMYRYGTLLGFVYPVIAAGAPWFMTLFGRDSLIASYMSLVVDPTLALGVLDALAELQGRAVDARTEEQPGRVVH